MFDRQRGQSPARRRVTIGRFGGAAASRPAHPAAGKQPRVDVLSWLRRNRHGRIAAKIEAIVRRWRRQGKRTRRNWWVVLAGDKKGRPRRVGGTPFPVILGARRRQSHQTRGERS